MVEVEQDMKDEIRPTATDVVIWERGKEGRNFATS